MPLQDQPTAAIVSAAGGMTDALQHKKLGFTAQKLGFGVPYFNIFLKGNHEKKFILLNFSPWLLKGPEKDWVYGS